MTRTLPKRLRKISANWKNTESPGKIDILLMTILLVVTTLCFIYGDVLVTIEHSFNFIDSVLNGNFFDFYQVAIENSTFGHPAVYEFPIYIVFAIWNLPIYILNKLTAIDFLNSFPCLLWSKMMLVVFTFLATKVLYSISKEIGLTKERCKWVAFFFLTSSTVVIPVFMIVQYDIISLVFMMLGILNYMRGNTKKFILWFVLANTMKLFSVFIFIPLILLKEKKLVKICFQTILGMAGIALCRLIYGGNAAYQVSTKGFSGTMLERLQATSIKWQYDGFVIPLFVMLMVGVCIFAYAKSVKDTKERNRFTIYIPLVIFLAFMGLVPFNPYWMILVAPYAVLIIFITPKHLKLNILLETGIGLALVWISVMINYPVFHKGILSSMFMGKLISADRLTRFAYLREFFIAIGLGDMVNFAAAFLIACVLAVLVINYPRRQYIDSGLNTEKVERGCVWIHGAVPCVFAMLMMLCYVWPAAGLVYTSSDGKIEDSSLDLLQANAYVEEKLKFDDNLKLKKLEIGFKAEGFEWINSSIVNISLLDDETGVSIWNTSKPVNTFEGEMVSFDTKNLVLKENRVYTLRITGENGEDVPLYVRIDENRDQFKTYENGKIIDGDLCINLYGAWEQ